MCKSPFPPAIYFLILLSGIGLAESPRPVPPGSFEANFEIQKSNLNISPKDLQLRALKRMISLQQDFLYKRLDHFSQRIEHENHFPSLQQYLESEKNIELSNGEMLQMPSGLLDKIEKSFSPKDTWAAVRLIIEMEDYLRGKNHLQSNTLASRILEFPIWDKEWPGSKVANYYLAVLFAKDKTLGLGIDPSTAALLAEIAQNLDAPHLALEKLGSHLLEERLKGNSISKALESLDQRNPFSGPLARLAEKKEEKPAKSNRSFTAEQMLAAGILGAASAVGLKVGGGYASIKYKERCARATVKLSPTYLKVSNADESEAPTSANTDEFSSPTPANRPIHLIPNFDEITARSGIYFKLPNYSFRVSYWTMVPGSIYALAALSSIHLLGYNPMELLKNYPFLAHTYMDLAIFGMISLPLTGYGIIDQQVDGGGFKLSYTNYNLWKLKIIIENLKNPKAATQLKSEDGQN